MRKELSEVEADCPSEFGNLAKKTTREAVVTCTVLDFVACLLAVIYSDEPHKGIVKIVSLCIVLLME